jgi:hypothetical protein
VSGLGIAARYVLEELRDEHVALLDTVLLLAIEQSLRPREPAARGGRLSSKQQVLADPERAAGR